MAQAKDPKRSESAKRGWDTRRKRLAQKEARPARSLPPRRRKRSFEGALTDTLLSKWVIGGLNINADIRAQLHVLRARSQDLFKNNEHVNRFISLLVQNVVGQKGIRLQVRGVDNGVPDKIGNQVIEDEWHRWCRKGNASADGRFSFCDLEQLALKTVAIDGEIFFRKVIVGGEFRVQPILSQWIDETFNEKRRDSRIEMGIEMDSFRRPIAYWITVDPLTQGSLAVGGANRLRVAASEILHLYKPDRPDQIRGVPWTTSIMRLVKILDGYTEAELVAARTAAAKMGFIVTPTGDEFTGDVEDEDGNLVMDAEPGSITQLSTGSEFQSWDPTHPTTAFKDFVKAILRSIASGLNVSYNSLASDLEGVNYSSIRQGVLDDRDSWRLLQNWLIESFHQPVYEAWLESAMRTGKVRFSFSKERLEKFSSAKWSPRGFSWIDPVADVQANLMAVQMGVKSLTEITAEQGRDFEETVEEIAREREILREAGLEDVLSLIAKHDPPAAKPPEQPEEPVSKENTPEEELDNAK